MHSRRLGTGGGDVSRDRGRQAGDWGKTAVSSGVSERRDAAMKIEKQVCVSCRQEFQALLLGTKTGCKIHVPASLLPPHLPPFILLPPSISISTSSSFFSSLPFGCPASPHAQTVCEQQIWRQMASMLLGSNIGVPCEAFTRTCEPNT